MTIQQAADKLGVTYQAVRHRCVTRKIVPTLRDGLLTLTPAQVRKLSVKLKRGRRAGGR